MYDVISKINYSPRSISNIRRHIISMGNILKVGLYNNIPLLGIGYVYVYDISYSSDSIMISLDILDISEEYIGVGLEVYGISSCDIHYDNYGISLCDMHYDNKDLILIVAVND